MNIFRRFWTPKVNTIELQKEFDKILVSIQALETDASKLRRKEFAKMENDSSHVKLCEQGNAMFSVAKNSRDAVPALQRWDRAMKMGNNTAKYSLAQCILAGYGIEQNTKVATKMFKELAQDKHNWGMLAYANTLTYRRSKAFNYYRQAADNGATLALYNVGKMYMSGDGVRKDTSKAIEYFAKSINIGDTRSMRALAAFYAETNEVEKATKIRIRAAKLNDPTSLYELGLQYRDGNGVQQSYQKAHKYLTKAANLNLPSAMMELGKLFESGNGVSKNLHHARNWYARAKNMKQ